MGASGAPVPPARVERVAKADTAPPYALQYNPHTFRCLSLAVSSTFNRRVLALFDLCAVTVSRTESQYRLRG
jgi:hypothetical protein